MLDRLDNAAERGALKGEEKRRETHDKARLRELRAEEAKQAREAMQHARNEKLAFASDRVEESSRRAASILQANAAKNANVVKRALAVVAANKEQQREAAADSATRLDAKIAAASQRRLEHLESAVSPRAASRMEMARVELARLDLERLDRKLELDRSIAAATERRENNIESRVDRARSSASRVLAAHDTKAQLAVKEKAELSVARKIHFAKLNDADVRVKLARASCKDAAPVAFEIPVRDGKPVARLPAALERRLQVKSRTSPFKSPIDLETRKALSAAARVRFAQEDIAITRAVVELRRLRMLARGRELAERARLASARAAHELSCRASVAMIMNDRVRHAAVRRSADDAHRAKHAKARALRRDIAVGRRATRLLAVAANASGARRTAMVHARRDVLQAAIEVRGHNLHLREICAAIKQSAILRGKAALANLLTMPYRARIGERPSQLALLGAPDLDLCATQAPRSCALVPLLQASGQRVRFAPLPVYLHESHPIHHKTHYPRDAPTYMPAAGWEIRKAPATRLLPPHLVARLMRKTRRSLYAPAISLETRLALSAASRVAFALVDIAMVRATRELLAQRAAALATGQAERERRAEKLHRFHLALRVAGASLMNDRVEAAAVRRATIDARKTKRLHQLALRAIAAAGRRAGYLLNTTSNFAEARRAAIFGVHREVLSAAHEARAQSHRLRHLHAEVKRVQGLVQRSNAAHLCSLPFALRIQLRGGTDEAPRRPANSSARYEEEEPVAAESFGLVGRSPPTRRRGVSRQEPPARAGSIFATRPRDVPVDFSAAFPEAPLPALVPPASHDLVTPAVRSLEMTELDARIATQNALKRLGISHPFGEAVQKLSTEPPVWERTSTDETIISESSVLSDAEVQDLLDLASAYVQAAERAYRRSKLPPSARSKGQPPARARAIVPKTARPIVLCM
mmetsp:Transcript_23117/g.63388  ORF Transcript_23117/g.63388 Transcript_23117/m.63388 type:complete len:930 (-) Transcript_23117:477-3266(-)